MSLSKNEIDVEKVEIAFAKFMNTVPDEREPKLNISLIGCLAKSLHQLDIQEILELLKMWFSEYRDDLSNDYLKPLHLENDNITRHYQHILGNC